MPTKQEIAFMCLTEAKKHLEIPTVVCLCGSTRFIQTFHEQEFKETLAGKIVLTVGCDTKSDGKLFEGPEGEVIKQRLDELHKRKIDLADEILVLDDELFTCDKCGKASGWKWIHGALGRKVSACCEEDGEWKPYIDTSTRSEIEYAAKHDRKIRYLSQEKTL